MDDLLLLMVLAFPIAGTAIFSEKLYAQNLKLMSLFWLFIALCSLFFLGRFIERNFIVMAIVAAMSIFSVILDIFKFRKKPEHRFPCHNWLFIFAACLTLIGFLWLIGKDLKQF